MRAVVCDVLLALVALAVAAPQDMIRGGQVLVQTNDQGVTPPGEPEPDADGVVTAEIINVHKEGVILVQSSNTPQGAVKRQVIRDTWLQVLNRTSEVALPMNLRRSYVVWFVVPRVDEASDAAVTAEGKKHGDVIFTKQAIPGADDMDKFVSLCRWLRVAYFGRYDYAAFLQDDGLVNIQNLHDYLMLNGDEHFYGGFVNSFTKDPEDNGHDYYAPYVAKGTLVISAAYVEIISRDAMFIKHTGPTFDVGIGGFLQPFKNGAPVRIPGCVADITKVYSEVSTPIVINGLTPELMAALSKPPGILPAQATEVQTMNFHINPHPTTDHEPLCSGMDDTGACRIAAKLLTDPAALAAALAAKR